MNIKLNNLQTQLRKIQDLKQKKNKKKDICSKIFLVLKNKKQKKKSQKNNKQNQLLFNKLLNQTNKKEVFLITSLELHLQVQHQQNLSHLKNSNLSKINTTKKLEKHQIKRLTKCSKTKNSRKRAKKQFNQAQAQHFNINSV